MKPAAIVGGDPVLMRARSRAWPHLAELIKYQVIPCQKCGRDCVLSPEGMAAASGPSVTPDALSEGPISILCMWCAFAENPEILQKLDNAVAAARELP